MKTLAVRVHPKNTQILPCFRYKLTSQWRQTSTKTIQCVFGFVPFVHVMTVVVSCRRRKRKRSKGMCRPQGVSSCNRNVLVPTRTHVRRSRRRTCSSSSPMFRADDPSRAYEGVVHTRAITSPLSTPLPFNACATRVHTCFFRFLCPYVLFADAIACRGNTCWFHILALMLRMSPQPDQTLLSSQAFFMTWDDHEVINDFGPDYDQGEFLEKSYTHASVCTVDSGHERYSRAKARATTKE